MSVLRSHLEDYLALRRGLGFRLGRTGLHLQSFAGYLERAGAETVTIENAPDLGRRPGERGPRLLAPAAGRDTAVRPLPGSARPRHPGPAARPAARPVFPPRRPLPLLQR